MLYFTYNFDQNRLLNAMNQGRDEEATPEIVPKISRKLYFWVSPVTFYWYLDKNSSIRYHLYVSPAFIFKLYYALTKLFFRVYD